MGDYHMISPTVYVYSGDRDEYGNRKAHSVYGWYIVAGYLPTPVVSDPDGPGIGPWHQFYGEDPWYAKKAHLKACG